VQYNLQWIKLAKHIEQENKENIHFNLCFTIRYSCFDTSIQWSWVSQSSCQLVPRVKTRCFNGCGHVSPFALFCAGSWCVFMFRNVYAESVIVCLVSSMTVIYLVWSYYGFWIGLIKDEHEIGYQLLFHRITSKWSVKWLGSNDCINLNRCDPYFNYM
jgi:hypothetical protein